MPVRLQDTTFRRGLRSLEVESYDGLLFQNHCCSAIAILYTLDAVTAVIVHGANSVNTYFLNILFGVLSDEGGHGKEIVGWLKFSAKVVAGICTISSGISATFNPSMP